MSYLDFFLRFFYSPEVPPPSSKSLIESTMSPLLSLPLELRESILLYSIISEDIPTRTFDSTNRSRFDSPQDLQHVSRVGSDGVYYKGRPINSTRNLHLTCRQLRNETRKVCERYRRLHGNRYKLDVIMAYEDELACTWTQVPPLEKHVDALEVDVHIQGMSLRSDRNGFMDNNGSTGSTVWRLYSIVERFLRCGASPPSSPTTDRGLRVKALKINVHYPDKTSPFNSPYILGAENILPDRMSQYREQSGTLYLMHPEAVARFMFIWIEGLLRMSDPSYALPGTPLAKYGRLFSERMDTVMIFVDGWENERFTIFPSLFGGWDAIRRA